MTNTCPSGHSRSPENLYRGVCRECRRRNNRESQRRLRRDARLLREMTND